MSTVDAATLGVRVREARERAGLKQTELAQQVSLERTVLNKIESGTRRVTALELADLSNALGVRMASFFEEPLPAIVAHRSSQGLDASDSRIDEMLAAIASEVEFVQSLVPDSLTATTPIDAPWAVPHSGADAEELAADARELLGLDAVEPARNISTLVEKVGLWAFAYDFGVDTADAGMLMLRDGGVALVNSNNKVGRRRLALAHELGHFLLQDEYNIDWTVADASGDIESRIDRFARAFLLPKNGLASSWNQELKRRSVRDCAIVVASRFQVDMATLARRIGDLQLEGDHGQVRAARTTRTDIVENGLLLPPEELDGTSLPGQYQRAVIRAYREERISAERALELLRSTFEEGDLPAHRTRSEGEIWQFIS